MESLLHHANLLQQLRGSRVLDSVAVERGLSCFVACGILLDHRSNSCLPHWQIDSLLLSHQGSSLHLYLVFHDCSVIFFLAVQAGYFLECLAFEVCLILAYA